MGELISILAAVLGLIAGIVVFYFFSKKQSSPQESQSLLMLQQQLAEIRQAMDQKMGESTKIMQSQFSESAKIIRNVTERLTKLDETNRQVVNFADQLKNLQDILKNPKQRGILGEYYLETVLKNVLPPGSYQMQYAFSDGVIVDAVVFVDKRIIPIDSKFSLENYNRILEARDAMEKKRYEQAFVADLKIRIDETSKYVKPEENTMDFAFMFIPSEAVYYDLLINKVGAVADDTRNLINYAGQKRVIVVSPTSFLAYLQTVLQGLKNQKISEQTQDIVKQVEKFIINEKPDIVAIELDKKRFYAILNKTKLSFKDIFQMGVKPFLINLIGAYVEKKLGKFVGVSPGSEMKKAIELVKKHNLKLSFIDQDVSITMKKLSKAITIGVVFKFMWNIIRVTVFRKKDIEIFDIRKVPSSKIIDNILEKVKEKYPGIYKVLIEERNDVMAKNLYKIMREYNNKKIFAIVGAGHESEIINILKRIEA